MGLLKVDAVGLQMLAAHCQSWAAEIGGQSVPELVGMSCQATSGAVSAVHADVGVAGKILAARMQSTAANLTTAAEKYAGDDNAIGAHLRNQVTEV